MFAVYRPSGRIGALAIPLWLASLAVIFGIAFIYQLGLYWIPLIYVNFFLTVGFGMVCAALGGMTVNFGRVRNPLLGLLIAITICLTGLAGKFFFQYTSACAELRSNLPELLAGEGVPADDMDEAVESIVAEYTFSEHIQERVQTGWNIGRLGRNGAPISGIFVYLVWLIEAGMVIYFAWSTPYAAARAPFSEKLGEWASEEEVAMTLPISHNEMVDEIKAIDSVEGLLEIPIPKSDAAEKFAVYRINSIPGQETEDAYLSVDLMHFEQNNKGEDEAKFSPLVKYSILSSQQRATLLENAQLLQEAMEEYRQAVDAEVENAEAGDELQNDGEQADSPAAGGLPRPPA